MSEKQSEKQLLLLRHAKSDWSGDSGDDFARPLSARGRADAPRIGRWIAAHDCVPQAVVASPAARVLQTLELLCAEFPSEPEIIRQPDLYHGGDAQIRAAAAAHLGRCACVLVLAHNPGMEAALLEYCPDAPPFADGKLMPTCALALIDLDTARSARGVLRKLLRPSDLPGE
ncbi:MAG: histidine phosphatase family protein [Gammaproteobacteria bacterium]